MRIRLRAYHWMIAGAVVLAGVFGLYCFSQYKGAENQIKAPGPCQVVTFKVATIAGQGGYPVSSLATTITFSTGIEAQAVGPDRLEILLPVSEGPSAKMGAAALGLARTMGNLRLYKVPGKTGPSPATLPTSDTVLMSVSYSSWNGDGNLLRGVTGGKVLLSKEYIELGSKETLINGDRYEVQLGPNSWREEVSCYDEPFRKVRKELEKWNGQDVAVVFEGVVYAYPLKFGLNGNGFTLSGMRYYSDAFKLHILLNHQSDTLRVVFPPISVETRKP